MKYKKIIILVEYNHKKCVIYVVCLKNKHKFNLKINLIVRLNTLLRSLEYFI